MEEHLAWRQFDIHKEKLIGIMEKLTKDNVLVAFSGGVDSSLLLRLAVEKSEANGTKAVAVMANTAMHPYIIELDELKAAVQL